MSSLRNAVKRITHKERSQPNHRSHLGILEKKKDYKERAVHYHKKEDRINAARRKASFRNPDEFYFGMKNAQITEGKHKKTVEAEQREFEAKVGTDTIRIMKDQDLSYIRLQKQKDSKRIERLQSSLHFIEYGDEVPSMKRKHIVFVDSKEEASKFDVADYFDTAPELAGRAFNRPRRDTLRNLALKHAGCHQSSDEKNANVSTDQLQLIAKESRKVVQKLAKSRAAAYAEVEARTKRVSALERAEAHLVTEKLVASKGRDRKSVV